MEGVSRNNVLETYYIDIRFASLRDAPLPSNTTSVSPATIMFLTDVDSNFNNSTTGQTTHYGGAVFLSFPSSSTTSNTTNNNAANNSNNSNTNNTNNTNTTNGNNNNNSNNNNNENDNDNKVFVGAILSTFPSFQLNYPLPKFGSATQIRISKYSSLYYTTLFLLCNID